MARRHGTRESRSYADPNLGFAWLRMIGATTVVIDHSVPLIHPEQLTVFPESWNASPGYIALMGFFAMSGFQISQSWESDPSWWRFCAKRLLRIFPPVLVLVFTLVFVIGPLFTTLSTAQYFTEKQTWKYLVGTSLLFLLQHKLPGVYAENPYPWSVNGSLWTLPMEIVGYVLVLGVGLLVAIGVSRYLVLPVLLVALMVYDGRIQAYFGYHGDAGSLIEIPIGAMVAFMVPFTMGMVLHMLRDRVPLVPWVAAALLPIWIVLHQTPLDRYLLAIMASYGFIVLAYHWPKKLEVDGRWVFGSYGMYIWAFPLQQIIIAAGVRNEWLLMALAVPVAYAFGTLSWVFVEVPTQKWRRYLPKPAARQRTPADAARAATTNPAAEASDVEGRGAEAAAARHRPPRPRADAPTEEITPVTARTEEITPVVDRSEEITRFSAPTEEITPVAAPFAASRRRSGPVR